MAGGQLGVVRSRAPRQVTVLSWYDTRRGRYLAAHAGPGWLTVTDADRAGLRRRLAGLLAS